MTRNPHPPAGYLPALSLWQPLASLWAWGEKRHDTRSWRTDYTGPVVIHAAKTWNSACSELWGTPEALDAWTNRDMPTLPFGALVGVAQIVDCLLMVDSPLHLTALESGKVEVNRMGSGKEGVFGDWTEGRYALIGANHKSLETPIPWAGRQGWFYVPESIINGGPL